MGNRKDQNTTKRRLNFFQTIKAVLWGMFGVRKGRGYEEDMSNLNPVYLIIAAFIATLIFVVGLVMIAQWFIGQAI